MQTEMDKAAHQPILVLIVVVAMLFVHAINPADAGVIERASSPRSAQIIPPRPARP